MGLVVKQFNFVSVDSVVPHENWVYLKSFKEVKITCISHHPLCHRVGVNQIPVNDWKADCDVSKKKE